MPMESRNVTPDRSTSMHGASPAIAAAIWVASVSTDAISISPTGTTVISSRSRWLDTVSTLAPSRLGIRRTCDTRGASRVADHERLVFESFGDAQDDPGGLRVQ